MRRVRRVFIARIVRVAQEIAFRRQRESGRLDFLAQEGFSTVEEIAYVPQAELAAIEEFDENIVKELRNRARDVLLTQAIASEETLDQSMPSDDLLLLQGMTPDLALALARRGVRTREDLADQAVDDLSDIEGLTAEEAGKLIMTARAPWFDAGR